MRIVINRYYLVFIFLCMFSAAPGIYAQQYNFFQLSVNEGLIQSQATGITQDKQGYLWITTQGGVSRFDGKRFVHFTTKEGLPSNIVFAITCDQAGNIWFGTDKGLVLYDGRKFTPIALDQQQQPIIGQVIADSLGHVYVLSRGNLFTCTGTRSERLLPGNDIMPITAIAVSPSGKLWCGTAGKGIFIQDKQGWNHITVPETGNTETRVRRLVVTDTSGLILTNQGLYRSNGRTVTPDILPDIVDELSITSLATDADHNTWLGSASGVYRLQPDNNLLHFRKRNGFSDARTHFVFCDRENNTWIATDGQGIFRYSGDGFTFLNENSGLPDPVAMSLVKDGKKIWIATYNGVAGLQNGIVTTYPGVPANALQLMSAALDSSGRYWIGTYRGGILYYNGQRFIPCLNNEVFVNRAAIGELFTAADKRLWVAASNSFGRIENNRYRPLKTGAITWGFAQAGEDVLVATGEGLFVITPADSIYPATTLPWLTRNQVTGMLQDRQGNYWLHTNGDGILIWNRKTDKIIQTITKEDGLPSNVVYSLLQDTKNRYWAGTGYGLACITMDAGYTIRSVERFGKSQGMYGMEANKNALLEDEDGLIYYGTTNGVFVYNGHNSSPNQGVKQVLLESVNLFGQPLLDTALGYNINKWYAFPNSLRLRHDQHNISFNFTAINFRSADDISYQYYLKGSDTGWSAPSVNNMISFSSLSPGKYTLLIRARAGNSGWCQPLQYSFIIQPPFYQAAWFRILAIIALLLTGFIVQQLRYRWKRKRAADLERVKKEEQDRMRMKTAEDFHDEVGNKLTRISLLADVLEKKLGVEEKETTALAEAIKENAGALYTDARDIIWSLKPESDNLLQLLERIEYLGYDLFQYSTVRFTMKGLLPELDKVQLPPDYNRNIIMIVKEAMNNIIKHAAASEVSITVLFAEGVLTLSIQDNGRGFEPAAATKGSGIVNISNRIKRLNGLMHIESQTGEGAILKVQIPL